VERQRSPLSSDLEARVERLEKRFAREGTSRGVILLFQKEVYRYYRESGRNLPWRMTRDPYQILVSEIMLQQTQVNRVLEHYRPFLEQFPDFEALASASFRAILESWQGMGYNRRAGALGEIARIVSSEQGGRLPRDVEVLRTFPGIGHATASAIAAFAFDQPAVFIEINIRRVFLHFFFRGKKFVKDREILPLVKDTLDTSDPRSWYYALMDYGAMLGKVKRELGRQSAHYTRQAPFEGSDRQVRGRILKKLLEKGSVRAGELIASIAVPEERFSRVLSGLIREGFVKKRGDRLSISREASSSRR